MKEIKKLCVIGAGLMGSGIAAQIANSETEVLLLDIAKDGPDKSVIAKSALEKMLVNKPESLSHPSKLKFITPGNLEDDLDKIKDCQIIIEAIIEKLDVKQELYNKLIPFCSKNTILASNTSTLSLKSLKEKLPDSIAQNFMILHFFNPPRYMTLLELISDNSTSKTSKEIAYNFITHFLGKDIVECSDTPGFIANRIGCFLLELCLSKTIEYKLDIELIDFAFHKYLFLPSTAIFGLYDLIGIDVMQLISASLINNLDKNDKFLEIHQNFHQINQMITGGYIGRKGLGGFYRINKNHEAKVKESLDLNTMQYSPCKKQDLTFVDINDLLSGNTNLSRAMNDILSIFGSYVCSLIPKVSDNIYDIDKAMRLGYNWQFGPFEIFHKIIKNGFENLAQNTENSIKFLSSKDYKNIESSKFDSKLNLIPKFSVENTINTPSFSLTELKNNKLCFSINTKMNCFNEDVFNGLIDAVSIAEEASKTLYIYHDSKNFSAGANLHIFLENNVEKIEDFLQLGQKAMMKAKYSKVPVISCASGVALGGGCELLLHSHFVVAHQQLSAGLVEVGIGLIPGWGGTKEMIIRGVNSSENLLKNLQNIILQNKSSSAEYFSYDYQTPIKLNMNRNYLLDEALSIKNINHSTKENRKYKIPSIHLAKSIKMDTLDKHTENIVYLLQEISGKEMTEYEMLDFEREIFMKLVCTEEAKNKIRKILNL